MDYCCSVMVGISGHILHRPQSALNAAVQLVFSATCSLLLHDLHWLPVPEWIRFHLCILTYCCLNDTSHLSESTCQLADVEGRRHLHSSATTALTADVQQLTVVHSSRKLSRNITHHLPSLLPYYY